MKNGIKKFVELILGIGTIYLVLIIYPNPLFAHKYQYKNFSVHSDKPISERINFVLDDVIQRLENSELYESKHRFRLYLCNDDWRFRLLTRNGNAGGVVNFLFSPNIFIRKIDVEKTQLIPPYSWKNPLTDRPLSHFIGHEGIHSFQKKYDNFLIFKAPVEILKGCADYVAKSHTNEIYKLIEQFKDIAPTMNPKNGLYDKYNLYVAYLMERKGYNFTRIVKEQPELVKTLNEITEE